MIKTTLQEVITAEQFLAALSNEKLRSKAAYQVARLIHDIRIELELFQERRIALIEKYADHDDNGEPIVENNQYKISKESSELLDKEYKELVETEITLNANKIQLELLDDEAQKVLSPNEMETLLPFIEE